MDEKKVFWVVFLLGLLIGYPGIAQEKKETATPKNHPVFQVDYPYPTADKPQSKLWYMANSWWALLPRSSGPSLWQRTAAGWKEQIAVGKALAGVPGRADVWANATEVTAVGVGEKSLTVFRLVAKTGRSGIRWETRVLATLKPPTENQPIETATLAQDKTGGWWVAADAGNTVCVWNGSNDGKEWSAASVLAEGIGDDDICTIAAVPGGVGVIWADQVRDQVVMRRHLNGQPVARWEEPEIVEAGNKTADDHLNTALAADSTLWVVTKNSLDKIGQPQLVLRIRSKGGKWSNQPYANLDSINHPTRPVIIATNDPAVFLAGHTVYDYTAPFRWHVVFGRVDTRQPSILVNPRVVIFPDSVNKSQVNDITDSKKPFPAGAPWIILTSDKAGKVYEADLRTLTDHP